jgi:CheY-like chemotaxis protein
MTSNGIALTLGLDPALNQLIRACKCEVETARHGIDLIRKIAVQNPALLVTAAVTRGLTPIILSRVLALLRIPIPHIIINQQGGDLPGDFQENPAPCINRSQAGKSLPPLVQQLTAKQPVPESYSLPFRQREWCDAMAGTGRKRVLLVDDSATVRRIVLLALDKKDAFDLYHAVNGYEGLVKSLLIQPDLIVSDMEMPYIDGISMSQLLYVLGKPFPIVFLTGDDDAEMMQRVGKLKGVLGFIGKHTIKKKSEYSNHVTNYLQIGEEQQETIRGTYVRGTTEHLLAMGQFGILKRQ